MNEQPSGDDTAHSSSTVTVAGGGQLTLATLGTVFLKLFKVRSSKTAEGSEGFPDSLMFFECPYFLA